MDLAQNIKQHYFDNFEELPMHKRFHFASRLAAWQGDPRAYAELQKLSAYMLPGSERSIEAIFGFLLSRPAQNTFAFELRKKYFGKFPELFGIHNSLFRVRHLKEFYSMDVSNDLEQAAGKQTMLNLYEKICEDDEAIRVLSTFAINYMYLYEILFLGCRDFNPGRLGAIADGYSEDRAQLNLRLYLITHAVIADSNFYARSVPADRLQLYRQLLRNIEPLIDNPAAKLDNQLEFLIACDLCGLSSIKAETIGEQAASSLDVSGRFIIDPLNGGANAALNMLAGAEHRNVLYIMSQFSRGRTGS